LRTAVSNAAGHDVAPAAVTAFRLCYAAFQGGLWSMAESAADAAERARIQPVRERYAAVLRNAGRN